MGKPRKQLKPKEKGLEGGSGRWMLTYLDMVTLLFGVFIIMYAMSNLDQSKFEKVAEVLKEAFNRGIPFEKTATTMGGSIPHSDLKTKVTLSEKTISSLYMSAELRKDFLSKNIMVYEIERGYKFSLVGDFFFAPTSAELNMENAREPLLMMSKLLLDLPSEYRVEVVGHTDDVPMEYDPINPGRYPTNWELSTARACSIIRVFTEYGVNPKKMVAEGRGEFNPIKTNATEEGRAYNRRVEIFLLNEEETK